LFLVQVLINLYRYNAKLAGQYRAAADALLLAGDVGQVDGLMETMMPSASFEKIKPTLPEKLLEHVAEVLAAAAEQAKKAAENFSAKAKPG
jgi:hypothetical protein